MYKQAVRLMERAVAGISKLLKTFFYLSGGYFLLMCINKSFIKPDGFQKLR